MRTVFDIVLGILATVLKAAVQVLASTAGVLALCAAAALAAFFLARRLRSAKLAKVVSIDR